MSSLTRICAGGLCLMLLLVFAGAAQAHRVNIFAWLEGETVRVECSFRRDSPVRQGTVIVFDAQTGRELLQGRTDGQGAFAFPVPAVVRQGHGLRIRILAGEGHQNEWQMDAAEFSSLLPAAGTGTTVPVAEDGTGAPSTGPAADGGSGAAAPAGGDRRCGAGPASGPCAACPCRQQRSGARPAGHRGRSGLDHGPGGHRTVLFPAPALA